MQCNLCQSTNFSDFNGRKNARCTTCHSLERTRALGLYLEQLELVEHPKILHLAPEAGLAKLICKRFGSDNYFAADMHPDRYRGIGKIKQLDLCKLDEFSSKSFDLIVHSHVLEHTPCNIAYSLFHLHRMMTATGRHIFVIPIVAGAWDECFSELPENERVARFGQIDHVRRFGVSDIDQHIGSLVDLSRIKPLAELFSERKLKKSAIPKRSWYGLCMETIIDVGKNDLMFF